MSQKTPKQVCMFRPGFGVSGVSADAVACELEKLRDREGVIAPESVVAAASKPSSSMHKAFEWDDSAAAHQHRLWQARQLIRAIVVVVENEPAQPRYIHVRTEDSNGYQPVEVVVRDRDMLKAALGEFQGKIDSLQNTVNQILGLAKQRGEVRVAKQIVKVGRKLEEASQAASSLI